MNRQTITLSLEIKDLSTREFEGHGSVFGNVDLGGDVVVPGAFKRSLAEHKRAGTNPQMFWMHNPSQVPGVWSEMREDSKGLYVRGELVDTDLGNEMRTLLQKKAVRGLSIGFMTRDADYDTDGNRLLKEIDLWEVSLVSLAMNPLAQVESAKSRLSGSGEYVPTKREFEHILRDAGLSRKVARTLIAQHDQDPSGMLGGDQRDADPVDDETAELLKALDRLSGKFAAAALETR